MARCFDTGVHRPLRRMYKLRRNTVQRLAEEHRRRAAQLEFLLDRLGPIDRELTIVADGRRSSRRVHRLVCEEVVSAIRADVGHDDIFVNFLEWLEQKKLQHAQESNAKESESDDKDGNGNGLPTNSARDKR